MDAHRPCRGRNRWHTLSGMSSWNPTKFSKRLALARKDLVKTQKEIAYLCEIGQSSISEFERGKLPGYGSLSKLANGYSIPLEELTDLWNGIKNGSVAISATTQSQSFAIGHIERHRQSSVHEPRPIRIEKPQVLSPEPANVFQASAHVLGYGDHCPRVLSVADSEWQSVHSQRGWSFRVVHVDSIHPAKLLAELHRISPNFGSLHFQAVAPKATTKPPYVEIWCTVEGNGLLLIERNDDGKPKWHQTPVSAGMCGRYDGADRHVWVNATEKPLYVLFVCFPYRARTSADFIEVFTSDKWNTARPDDVGMAIRTALASQTK